MRKLLYIIILFPFLAVGQPYGNEWINFDQEYYKVMVREKGIYRISYDDLNEAGFPVATVDPQLIQMFRKGQEMAIHVEGQGDGSFDPADYLEFYGQRNDGKLDMELYVTPEAQAHQYGPLYSDSAAYFLTIHASIPGKRMNTLPAFTGPTPDQWVDRDVLSFLQDEYASGVTEGEETSLTEFDYGEGFMGRRAIEVSRPNRDIVLTGVDFQEPTGPNPKLELVVVGRNFGDHEFEVLAGPNSSGLASLGTFSMADFSSLKIESDLNWSQISAGGVLQVRVSVLNNGGNRSILSIAAAKVTYARQTNANNLAYLEVETEAKTVGGNTISLVNTLSNADAFDITNPYNVKRIADSNPDLTTIDIGFADATNSRKIAVAAPDDRFSLHKVPMRQINATIPNYLIVSHPRIMNQRVNGLDAVKEYAAYRATAQGGGFDTLVCDITMLFNQFSYGQPTPLAMFRFMVYMSDGGNPEYLFIIGKGFEAKVRYHKKDSSLAGYNNAKDLIPPAGSPGSDLAYTSNLGRGPHTPAIPVGRLSVMTAREVMDYLNKIRDMESAPYDALWRKKLLHLSGGNSLFELELFKDYVDGFGEIAKDHYLGGEITTISKQTTGAVEFINVSEEVNAGLNLITFFGHSAANVIDIDIGYVSDEQQGYDNQGKYPLILMNGCNSGNIYQNAILFSEDWVKTANKGSTGAIAHSSYGFPYLLRLWTQSFYSLAYADTSFIDQSIGDIMIQVNKDLIALYSGNINYAVRAHVQQMGLQGDPAMKLFGTRIPDYELSESNVNISSYDGSEVTAELDSFRVVLGARNFGTYLKDSLELTVQRTLDNGTIINYDTISFPPSRFFDTLTFNLDNREIEAVGNNRFYILLDPLNKIDEHNELNNQVDVPININTAGTYNIQPQDYSLRGDINENLLIHPGNLLMQERDYVIELDTEADFSSPIMTRDDLRGQDLISWEVNLPDQDTAVYYWRSKYKDVNPNESGEWAQSSFSVIKDSGPGWAQLEFDQVNDNSLTGLTADAGNNSFNFLESDVEIEVVTHGVNKDSLLAWDTQLRVNGQNYIYYLDRFTSYLYCPLNKLYIVSFNKENAAPYAAILGSQTEPWTCGRSPQIINTDYTGGVFDYSIADVIDAVGNGDKVIVFTIGSFDFNTLPDSTITRLEDLGADATILANKAPGNPYILVGEKGIGAGNAQAEVLADPSDTIPEDEQTIRFLGNITGIYSSGSIKTTKIGPADDWQSLSLDVALIDGSDDFDLDIRGIGIDGNAQLLLPAIKDEVTDLSGIDASLYPYLELDLQIADTADLTAPQLKQWIVNYTPSAEGYLHFDSLNNTREQQIALNQGEELLVKLTFTNISDQPFNADSLRVEYTSFNLDSRTGEPKDTLIIAPKPGESIPFQLPINTIGKVGKNDFTVVVNPMEVIEQEYANNRLSLTEYLTVLREESNPVLDVSFDGEYIFDGDIVSPNPNITIQIRDENPYLYKTDTSGVDVFLKKPCEGCNAERISLAGDDVVWVAQDEKNPFTIEFTPKELADGIYELRVQGEDASGNPSGTEPYRISFEVINESTVTNFYPYPNPFSTSVQFVFTLTGSEVPDEIMIRIMTVSGRVVKEIMQDELGPLKIGNNITDYAWDGRDEFGDQLANGVYLYKVFLRKNGQNVELRPSAGDRGFKNGYGKLYLLR